jgi:hypothetical protein
MFNLKQFNDLMKNRQVNLEKALSTANASALIPEYLDKVITNILQRLTPEFSLFVLKKIASNKWNYNRLTALPTIGGAMGETGATPAGQSTYVRKDITLKEVRRIGEVTDFMADSSQDVIDAVAEEIQNNLLAHCHDVAHYSIWGNEFANVYEFSGLDFYIGELTTTIHGNRKINARYGTTPTTIKDLDDMIDYSNRRGGANHARVLMMSPELCSLFGRLITSVHDNREIKGRGFEQLTINGGWRLWAYRDIPIVETSALTPIRTMTTITPTVGGSGSGLGGAANCYIRVAEVTKDGEQLCSAEVLQALSTADTLTLTWAAPTNSDVYEYRIYMGTATNAGTLKKIIPGKLYTSGAVSGNVVTVTFSSNPNVADPTVSAPASFAGIVTTVPVHMRDDLPYEQEALHAAPETVILWDLSEVQGLGQMVYTNTKGSQFNGLVTSENFGKTDFFTRFGLRSTLALVPRYEGTSFMVRGLRAL